MKMEMKRNKRIKKMEARETHLYLPFTSLTKFRKPHVRAKEVENSQMIIVE